MLSFDIVFILKGQVTFLILRLLVVCMALIIDRFTGSNNCIFGLKMKKKNRESKIYQCHAHYQQTKIKKSDLSL